LDSIADVHRLKDRNPEDIASIWDDVMSRWLLVLTSFKLVLLVDSVVSEAGCKSDTMSKMNW